MEETRATVHRVTESDKTGWLSTSTQTCESFPLATAEADPTRRHLLDPLTWPSPGRDSTWGAGERRAR